MRKEKRHIRISHRPTGTILAEGLRGWDITPFEGNFYIRSGCIKRNLFIVNYIPRHLFM
jgi:hypothetical protein